MDGCSASLGGKEPFRASCPEEIGLKFGRLTGNNSEQMSKMPEEAR